MSERTVTMRGAILEVAGEALSVGDPAPAFSLIQRGPDGLREVTLGDFEGKTLIISVVPSLDSPVCEKQTVRFNDEAISLPLEVEVLTVSMDLPFAQARFCNDKGTHQIQTASDHFDGNFGRAYGVLVESLRLLCRAVFVINNSGVVMHAEYVPEVTDQPDYDTALAAARQPTD